MSHEERLFFAQLTTVIFIFLIAMVDFEWIYVKMEESLLFLTRLKELIKFKIWANTHGIKRHKK